MYCGSAVETIDHVIPLVRGGTNYEGNLAPCCRVCNSSKGGLLVSEWKTGIHPNRENQPKHPAVLRAA